MEDKLKQLLKKLKMNESWISMILGLITVVIVGSLLVNYWQNSHFRINLFKSTEQEKVSTPKENQEAEKTTVTKTDKEKVYTVKRGDYLWKIAEEIYGSGYNWVDIAKANKLTNPGKLYAGQKLKLPEVKKKVVQEVKPKMAMKNAIKGDRYKVQKGDNLWQIAIRAYNNGYKWVEIARVNKLRQPNKIEVGQELIIPRK